MDALLRKFAEKFGNITWINTFTSKGPIVIMWSNRETQPPYAVSQAP